jgi:hypothetical protein
LCHDRECRLLRPKKAIRKNKTNTAPSVPFAENHLTSPTEVLFECIRRHNILKKPKPSLHSIAPEDRVFPFRNATNSRLHSEVALWFLYRGVSSKDARGRERVRKSQPILRTRSGLWFSRERCPFGTAAPCGRRDTREQRADHDRDKRREAVRMRFGRSSALPRKCDKSSCREGIEGR